ncbi:MAG TPA: class I SAM-dependent methyltransferase [Actinomycetes bacterium]|nr:class I SAM-dependent methyltransferase [Actinomycetes bacterium]
MQTLHAPEPVQAPAPSRDCRFCGAALRHVMIDLGMSPLCETYPAADQLDRMEPFYPLRVLVCEHCLLAQLPEYVPPEEIFTEYAYFSSYSDSWVDHARRYAETMRRRLGLGGDSLVVELASNDGYLLQHFLPHGVPVLGVEPAHNVAAAAVERGVDTVTEFFGVELATRLRDEGRQADLLVANNVLAQVPDLNDFVAGMAILLAPEGTATVEFPHLAKLVAGNQFDTIYHEHFSYFSLLTAVRVFEAHGLAVFDLEALHTHGGSLRLHVRHRREGAGAASPVVGRVLATERAAGMTGMDWYAAFGRRAEETRYALVEFLVAQRREGRQVAGYGAPGKGNTLLNFCGIRSDLLAYTVDRNPYKQGRFLPGTHIPIHHPDRLGETRPDVILILPWNLRAEIVAQLAPTREWGARLAVPIPRLEVFPPGDGSDRDRPPAPEGAAP